METETEQIRQFSNDSVIAVFILTVFGIFPFFYVRYTFDKKVNKSDEQRKTFSHQNNGANLTLSGREDTIVTSSFTTRDYFQPYWRKSLFFFV